ncbi:MAG: FAD-dependent oxidoreductase [Opitutales bacterium]|nr:FAD-dependent oxidoreductase [Opitutales bacterium]
MKRREFISDSILAFGGLMLSQNFTYADVKKETSRLFSLDAERGYDVVINSTGLAGAFMALSASQKGLRVLLVDRRTSVGWEMVERFNLSLDKNGFENWGDDMKKIFFPDDEKLDIDNKNLTGECNSELGDKVVFLGGSINKSLSRSLVMNGVDVLFMADVFGVFKDDNNAVSGVAIATKQGAIAVKCASFVDCGNVNIFTRNITKSNFEIVKSTFTLRFWNAKKCPENFAINLNSKKINAKFAFAKTREDCAYLTFEVPCKSSDFSAIERSARLCATEILENKKSLPKGLHNIFRTAFARECLYFVNGELKKVDIKNYFVFENPAEINSCDDVFKLYTKSVKFGKALESGKARESIKFVSANGEALAQKFGERIVEDGFATPFYRFDLSNVKAEKIACDVLVAGVGSAGVFALKSATERGANALGVECFHDYGGTKVNGGVIGYYCNVKTHPLIIESTAQSKKTNAIGVSGGTIYSVINLKLLEKSKIITGAILCGASVENGKLVGAYFTKDSKLYFVESKVAIDCTGDADLSAFAGVPFAQGENRSGISINFSKWEIQSISAKTAERRLISKDFGIVDITKITDFQRAMILAHYQSSYYDSYPQLTPRDTRRPLGVKTLELAEALEGKPSADIIAQAFSDYDPHSVPMSKFARTAMMLPHFPHYYAVNIPFGCVVPKNLNGLLFGGRSISVSHDVLQFTRMSGDVATLGEVEGRIASDFAKCGGNLADFDVSKIVEESTKLGYYTDDYLKRTNLATTEIIERLARGDSDVLIWACLKPKAEILPMLRESFKKVRTLQTAYALSWFGDNSGEKVILRELKNNLSQEEKEPQSADYLELYWRGNLKSPYWNINRALAFLAMSGSEKSDKVVAEILSKTTSGGKLVRSKDNVYTANRIDLVLLPNHNRIVNLCFYAERRPSIKFAKGFERLLDDSNIACNSTRKYSEGRFNMNTGLLEMLVASASARCGSPKGASVLVHYLGDYQANFRAFAHQELCDIYKQDFSFDALKWQSVAKEKSGVVANPLSEKFR